MSKIKLCIDGDGTVCTTDTSTIKDALGDNCRLVWLDVSRDDRDKIQELSEKYDFHELAVEDAIKGGQRPKIDVYENQIFLVFYTIVMDGNSISTEEIAFFIGHHFIVTVHDGEIPVLDDVAKRWNSVPSSKHEEPKGLLVYAMLDAIVDNYFPVMDELGEKLEALETRMLEVSEHKSRSDVLALRRELLSLRRIISAERDVVNTLLRHDMPMFSDTVTLYITDVYDHLLRSYDWLESYRDQLATMLDLQSAAAANRLNQIMKTLTASSIMLMSASLISGIYGMNFVHMPELDWLIGYPLALGLMAVIMGVLYVIFRQRDWL